jgi:hypothetical protein
MRRAAAALAPRAIPQGCKPAAMPGNRGDMKHISAVLNGFETMTV